MDSDPTASVHRHPRDLRRLAHVLALTVLLGLAGLVRPTHATPPLPNAPQLNATPALALAVDQLARASASSQERKDDKKRNDRKQDRKKDEAKKKQPPHSHTYQRATTKVWIEPVTRKVVVGKDKKGNPVTKTVTVKPGRYETRVQQRCRCGAIKK